MKPFIPKNLMLIPTKAAIIFLIYMGAYSSIEKLTDFHITTTLSVALISLAVIAESLLFAYYKSIGRSS